MKNVEWTLFFALMPVETPIGTIEKQPAMRRKKTEGGYEYRVCSPEERAEYENAEAW